jgi:hypothetical protein
MPFAGYKDFDDCLRKNRGKKNPKAYCGAIKHKAESEKGATDTSTSEVRVYEVFEDLGGAEFSTDDDKMEAKITILREGRSKNRRHYNKYVLKEAVREKLFDNMRMFVDHSATPPLKRGLREMVSATGATQYEEDEQGVGRITANVKFFSRDFFDFAKRARDHMGDSLSARLQVVKSMQPGGHVEEQVQRILKGYSVDWVAFPAAGGGIEHFVTEGEGVDSVEWDELTEEMLKEHAPALYDKLTAHEQDDGDDDEKDDDTADDGDDDAESVSAASIEAIVDRRVNEAIETFKKDEATKAEAARQTAALVDATSLPDSTKARLSKQFDGQPFVESKVQEAIEEARKELQEAGAGPKVTGMGVTAATGGTRKFAGKAEEAVAAVLGYKPSSDAEAEKN